MDDYLQAAIDEAGAGLAEGGIPIGLVLVVNGEIVGRRHNRRVQRESAILLYRIPRVVENRTLQGSQEHLRSRGVQVEIVDDPPCGPLMAGLIAARPELWNGDIGG